MTDALAQVEGILARRAERRDAIRPVPRPDNFAPGGECDRASAECAGPVHRYMNTRLCDGHGPARVTPDPELTAAALLAKRLAHLAALREAAR